MDSDDSSKNAPIYLNVYDVTDINNCLYWLGLGIFHSAIEGILLCLCLFNCAFATKFRSLLSFAPCIHMYLIAFL